MHLMDLHSAHRRHLMALRRAPGTADYYRYAVNELIRYMEQQDMDPEIEQVSKATLQGFVLYLREKGLKPGGEHATMRAVRATIRWALEEEYITRDPLKGFKLASVPKALPPSISDDEARTALRVAGEMEQPLRNRALLLLLLDTGLRMSEALQLRVDDVDITRGVVTVRAETSKRQKERRVPIGIKTAKHIGQYIRRERRPARQNVDTLFLSRHGTPLTKGGLHALMRRIAEAGSIEPSHVSPHAWRRAFATMTLRNGGDVFTLREMMGHATLEQTRVYLRLSEDDLQRVHAVSSPVDRL